MNRRSISVSLTLIFLLFAGVGAASAVTRSVGVVVGDTFTYSATSNWLSNDPGAQVPGDLVTFNSTRYVQIVVAAISGTNVSGTSTTRLWNGTEETSGGWVDVNDGEANNLTTWFIASNLVQGNTLYVSTSPYNVEPINETVSRTYVSGARETNHLNLTTPSSSGGQNVIFSNNLYWDKSTGVLVELLVSEFNQTGTYTTNWREDLIISSSNAWTIPEFLNWTPALLVLIALTSAIIIVSRQKRSLKLLLNDAFSFPLSNSTASFDKLGVSS